MGVACIGVSRKSFQPFRKIEKEEGSRAKSKEPCAKTKELKYPKRVLEDGTNTLLQSK